MRKTLDIFDGNETTSKDIDQNRHRTQEVGHCEWGIIWSWRPRHLQLSKHYHYVGVIVEVVILMNDCVSLLIMVLAGMRFPLQNNEIPGDTTWLYLVAGDNLLCNPCSPSDGSRSHAQVRYTILYDYLGYTITPTASCWMNWCSSSMLSKWSLDPIEQE